MHEQAGRAQIRQMLNAKLLRLARRMQRIGKQQQSGHQLRLRGAKHRRLPPAIGVAAQKNSARHILAQSRNRIAQTRAIAFRIARKRRAGSPLLAKGQIAAQNDVAMSGKSFAERHQQRSSAIRARAMRQDQSVAVGIFGSVQKSANSGI